MENEITIGEVGLIVLILAGVLCMGAIVGYIVVSYGTFLERRREKRMQGSFTETHADDDGPGQLIENEIPSKPE